MANESTCVDHRKYLHWPSQVCSFFEAIFCKIFLVFDTFNFCRIYYITCQVIDVFFPFLERESVSFKTESPLKNENNPTNTHSSPYMTFLLKNK